MKSTVNWTLPEDGSLKRASVSKDSIGRRIKWILVYSHYTIQFLKHQTHRYVACYAYMLMTCWALVTQHVQPEAEVKLKEAFNFRTWDDDSKEITYCGTVLSRKNYAWTVSQESYIHKVKPVTIHRNRIPEEEMTDQDRSQLRALLGSMQWPAIQTAPHLQCSCSLVSGKMSQNKMQAIVDANSLLHCWGSQSRMLTSS